MMPLFIGTIARWWRNRIRASGVSRPSQWLVDWVRGDSDNDAGVSVNGQTALQCAAFWQGVNVIAGDVMQLPLPLYRRIDDQDREKATEHPAFRLMRRRVNPLMSAGVFKQLLQSHALIFGNGYAAIERNGRSDPEALYPLMPDRTCPVMLESGRLVYETEIEVRPNRWEKFQLDPENVLHIRGLGWDGKKGYSVVHMARNSIGLALAQEKHGARFFKNSARPGGVIEANAGTTPENAKAMKDQWNEAHQSVEKSHLTAVLVDAKFNPVSQPNDDAQWLESRQFSRSEIASWFPLPPHKVNDLQHATFSNIEEQNRDYLNTSLMRWLCTWEDECNEKLLTERQKRSDSHFFEFNTASLLRGSLLARYQAYLIGRQGEWLSPNSVLRLENMNKRPDEGGDDFSNPNVKSGGSDEAEEDSGDAEEAEETEDAQNGTISRAIVSASIKQKIRNETRNVERYAKTAKNFCSVIDDFYDRFPVNLMEVIEPVGGTEGDAVAHCEWSKNRLMDVAGSVKPSELIPAIKQECEAWPARADALADILIERQNHETQ